MKRIIILFILCFCTIHLFAQNDKNNLIETHFSMGASGLGQIGVIGGGDYHSKSYYTISLDYSRQLSKRWDICSGLEYSYNSMTVTFHDFPEMAPRKAFLQLVTIPVQFKYHIGKVVYLNGGLLFNVLSRLKEETWVPSKFQSENTFQSENIGMLLGVGLGIGVKHEFQSGVILSLNPYARLNGFVREGKYVFIQAGASLGVGYQF